MSDHCLFFFFFLYLLLFSFFSLREEMGRRKTVHMNYILVLRKQNKRWQGKWPYARETDERQLLNLLFLIKKTGHLKIHEVRAKKRTNNLCKYRKCGCLDPKQKQSVALPPPPLTSSEEEVNDNRFFLLFLAYCPHTFYTLSVFSHIFFISSLLLRRA